MKYIDNDMDELFNKAGQDYPLNTDHKNWDAVYKALQEDKGDLPPPQAPKNFNRYYLLLFLMILPMLYIIINNRYQYTQKDNVSATIIIPPAEQAPNPNPLPAGSIRPRPAEADIATPLGSTNNDAERPDKQDEAKSTGAARQVLPNRQSVTSLSTGEYSNNNRPVEKNVALAARSDELVKSGEPVKNKIFTVTGSYQNNSERLKTLVQDAQTAQYSYLTVPLAGVTQPFGKPAAIISEPPVFKALHDAADLLTAKQKSKALQRRGFYYGVKGGPDFSSIKGQQVKQAGAAAGILAGYKLNNRWSIELAGLWSNKKYYTDGKYFDKSSAYMPSTVQIYYLDGSCDMIELPISVMYRFSERANTFFVSAGLNSYFMKKESYDYLAQAGGVEYRGYRKYKNSGNHIFSNMQLSGGYQFKILGNINLRIEPYVQVPVQKVGIGNMPITSMGVHLGIFRNIR